MGFELGIKGIVRSEEVLVAVVIRGVQGHGGG